MTTHFLKLVRTPLLTLADTDIIQETPLSSEQLDFQPGDVVGYYLEDNRDQNGGVQFDDGFTSEELWYATGNSNLQNDNLLEVGNIGDLIDQHVYKPWTNHLNIHW